MGSISGFSYGVGVLGGQRHKRSKNWPNTHTEDFIGNDFIEFPLFRHVLSNHHDDLWTGMVISVKEWAIYSVRSYGYAFTKCPLIWCCCGCCCSFYVITDLTPGNSINTQYWTHQLDWNIFFSPISWLLRSFSSVWNICKDAGFFDSDSLEEVTEILVFTLAPQRRHFYITVNCRLHLCRRQTTVSPIRSQNSRHSCTCTVQSSGLSAPPVW